MINILYWNCRGFRNAKTQRTICNMVKDHHPQIICLAEPMVRFDDSDANFRRRLNFELVTINSSALPSLWLLKSGSLNDPSVIDLIPEQVITFELTTCARTN